MAKFVDKKIKVTFTPETISIHTDYEIHTLDRGYFTEMINGNLKPLECLLFNLSVKIVLSGIDPADDAGIKSLIEASTFKF